MGGEKASVRSGSGRPQHPKGRNDQWRTRPTAGLRRTAPRISGRSAHPARRAARKTPARLKAGRPLPRRLSGGPGCGRYQEAGRAENVPAVGSNERQENSRGGQFAPRAQSLAPPASDASLIFPDRFDGRDNAPAAQSPDRRTPVAVGLIVRGYSRRRPPRIRHPRAAKQLCENVGLTFDHAGAVSKRRTAVIDWRPAYGRTSVGPRRRSPQWTSLRTGGRFPCPCGKAPASGWIGWRSAVQVPVRPRC